MCTLKYFLHETEFVKGNPEPFYESELQLVDGELVFEPSMVIGTPYGFNELIEGLIKNVYTQGSLITRIAPHLKQENYKSDLENMSDLTEMKQDFMERVRSIIIKANEYKDSFDRFAYLWIEDRKEFMRQFLLYNHVLTQEEIEFYGQSSVPESPPTLDQFKQQVNLKKMFRYIFEILVI